MYINSTYLNIINEYTNEAKQPNLIKIQLKPHQLKMLYKCLELEQKKIKNNYNNNIIETSIGVIGDPVGSGKSYIILSIICTPYQIRNDIHILSNTDLLTIYSDKYRDYIYKNINILVIPHNIFSQWQQYIKNTNLTVEYIKTNKNLNEITFDKQLIVLSSSFYNKFTEIVFIKKYAFSRVLIDEADSIKIPACKKINAYFYWFITSSIKNLLLPSGETYWENSIINYISGIKHNGFIKNTFLNIYNLRILNHRYKEDIKYLFLKNCNDLIKKSFLLPDPIIYNIICKNPKILNILNNIISDKVQKMIYAGDIDSAIKEIDIQKTDEKNLIKLVAQDLFQELENKKIDLESISKKKYKDLNKQNNDIQSTKIEIQKIEEKILNIQNRMTENNIDPITYEEIKNLVIINCCKSSFDFLSITTYISSTNNLKCPMCRSNISKDNLILVNDNIKFNDKKNKETNLLLSDKSINLKNILTKKINKNARIIIFSEYNNTYINIINILNECNIECKELKGNSNVIDKILNWYNDNKEKQKVLFLNARFYGSGLNLEKTSDIIIYHKMDLELENQVIGRAQRCGRTTVLNIWKLMYENE